MICQTDIHPLFKQMMSHYITHFHSVQWKTLLNASNITEAELPTIQKYMTTGRNNVCYAYILGKCQG
jgi:tRNA G46 methylase TrmB